MISPLKHDLIVIVIRWKILINTTSDRKIFWVTLSMDMFISDLLKNSASLSSPPLLQSLSLSLYFFSVLDYPSYNFYLICLARAVVVDPRSYKSEIMTNALHLVRTKGLRSTVCFLFHFFLLFSPLFCRLMNTLFSVSIDFFSSNCVIQWGKDRQGDPCFEPGSSYSLFPPTPAVFFSPLSQVFFICPFPPSLISCVFVHRIMLIYLRVLLSVCLLWRNRRESNSSS